ncbi:MAG: Hsp20/alpha crystallin family protein [Oligoflexia bacterium]|nr:Hsp20/alpha crystallin family protein [Oligoflexia bacterium]
MNALSIVNTLFDAFFPRALRESNHASVTTVWRPRVDLKEDRGLYKLTMDLPGLEDKDVKVEFKEGLLHISGERVEKKEEKKESSAAASADADAYYYQERVVGRFERSFDFGTFINEEEIRASMKNGVLEVTLPRKEEKRSRSIAISVNQ